jgi:starch synthase
VAFGGSLEAVDLCISPAETAGVRHVLLDHPRFAPQGPGQIYCDDDADAPFATDAGKFAFFCAAAATLLREGLLPEPHIIHLHDWPAALLLVLREYDPAFAPLKNIPTVFTIHNLALQGIRPLDGHPSSLKAWFPRLEYDEKTVTDPRWPDCVNPIAAAIRLADKVSTVSATYAKEILEPSDPRSGFSGGEGLETDLIAAHSDGRLVGILNGCAYPEEPPASSDWSRLLDVMRRETARWIAGEQQPTESHRLAESRLAALSAERPGTLLTSIGRVGVQKTRLFREPVAAGVSALEAILENLGDDALFIMLGSGDAEYEAFLTETAAAYPNFLFLRGYSDAVSELVYATGDLFLMPSSFEPCGISQMLAMRAGQLCVVHGVGGLKDTVSDGATGFVFEGDSPQKQAAQFVSTVADALAIRRSSRAQWQNMQQEAKAARFSWDASAASYEQVLYELGDD